MIKFTTIKLSEDKQTLTLIIELEDNEFTQNVYLGKTEIYDIKTWSTNTPVFTHITTSKVKRKELNIPVTSILTSLTNNMLIIKASISEDSVPSENSPCGYDNTYEIAVYADICEIVNQLSQLTTELSNTCAIPKKFINYFLLFKGLEYSLRSQKIEKSIEYYKQLIGISNNNLTIKSCGCNG